MYFSKNRLYSHAKIRQPEYIVMMTKKGSTKLPLGGSVIVLEIGQVVLEKMLTNEGRRQSMIIGHLSD